MTDARDRAQLRVGDLVVVAQEYRGHTSSTGLRPDGQYMIEAIKEARSQSGWIATVRDGASRRLIRGLDLAWFERAET